MGKSSDHLEKILRRDAGKVESGGRRDSDREQHRRPPADGHFPPDFSHQSISLGAEKEGEMGMREI